MIPLCLTSAGRLLSAPGQALLTNPALWAHQLITRVTQEVDLMAHAVQLSKFPSIRGCVQFCAGACWKSRRWFNNKRKKLNISFIRRTFEKVCLRMFCSLLMAFVVCLPALLCSRFIFFFRLRRLCRYEASCAERSFWTCFREPCISCLLGQSWNQTEGVTTLLNYSQLVQSLFQIHWRWGYFMKNFISFLTTLQIKMQPYILPPPRKWCFHHRLFVVLFVSRITQKLQNLVERWGLKRNHFLLVQM